MVNTKINLAFIAKGGMKHKQTYTKDPVEALESVAIFFAKHSDKEEYTTNRTATKEKIALFRQYFIDASANVGLLTDDDIKGLLNKE